MNVKNIDKVDALSYWLPLLLGILFTLVVAGMLNYQNEHEVKSYKYNLANKIEDTIKKNFQHFEYGLRGVRGAMSAVGIDDITRGQFESYSHSRNINKEFPGALGFGFIRRVPVNQEAQFIENARQKIKAPHFNIRTLTPHNNDRFVIQHIYPLEKNRQALGLDIGSESNRRSAALSAAREDKPYLTAPITLVQANKKSRKGALVLLPIYPLDVNLTTAEARENAVLGWSYAPLVIDDVLVNLELQADQASVTLTNTVDNEPFYHSKNSNEESSTEYKVSRNIYVLGQNWALEINPSYQVINQIKPWKISWIVLLGLGLTFCTLLVINLLRNNQISDDKNSEIYQLNAQSLLAFFKSSQFKKFLPFSFIIFLLIFLASSWLIIQNHLTEISNNLSTTKNAALSIFNDEATQYHRDVLFLASTPVIQTLKEIEINSEYSEKNNSKLEQLNERLADIFKAYMLSKIDVHQVRFIGATHDWKERVKVQRFDDGFKTLKFNNLQSKINESYIQQTLNAGLNNVFASDINLNREFGKIEKPNRPVWRFSTPLFYSDGSPFGIIIVNTSASNILKSAIKNVTKKTDLYITNSTGDFLLHPDNSKSFSFEHAEFHRWQNEFSSSNVFYGLSSFDLMAYVGEQGHVFAKQAIFPISKNLDNRDLKIYSITSQFLSFKEIIYKILSITLSLIFVFIISLIIQYWIWLNDIIRHRDNLKSQIEKQQIKETTRFKGLLESAPDATLVIDDAGIIQMVNAQAERMFGYIRLDLEKNSIDKLVPVRFKQAYKIRMHEYMNKKEAAVIDNGIELLALGSDGNEFPIEVSLSSINLDDKVLVSASVRNITERLAAEEILRKALRDAESATQAKSAFLANTSHEIRTPLNAVIGLGYLLSEEKLTKAQHQLVSKIQISGKSLLGIVNNVLDLAKIEANEMELDTQPVDLRELFEEVSEIFTVQAEATDLDFNIELDSRLPSWVMADSIRLRQIIINLLSNSLKFTTIGRITLRAEVLPKTETLSEDHAGVRISITDTGIGISTEAQSRLFKPFTQADSSTTRKFGGTGLGLSIVKQLVRIMGGEIGVESIENKGSKFWVDLTFKIQTAEEIVAQDNQNQALFLLIAEDNPDDAKQLQKMTRALGWRSEVVSNGDELVKVYLNRQEINLRPPDAIIVDWQMPIMDGIAAISSLANLIGRDSLPAVLMVSAHDKETINQHNHENLVNNILMKPVNSSALFNAVNNVVTFTTGNSHRVMQSTNTQSVAAKWLPNVNVLVVDDSPINLVVVSHILEHNGAIVQTANSGEEAIKLLEDSSNDYDAILMDVQMPGIDGLETTRHIRNHLELISLPIIALTAGALLEEKARALDAGMNDFLTKPINPSKLINVLRSLIETYRDNILTIESIDKNTTDQNTAGDEVWPEILGLNLNKAKNLLLGDRQLLLSTLDRLLIEYSTLALPPHSEIDRPESKFLRLEIASKMHKLRSASGMIGADKIQQLAAEAENILRSEGLPATEILLSIAVEIQDLKTSSGVVLDNWKKEKSTDLAPTEKAPLLELKKLQKIMTLLAEQDLAALDKIDEFSQSFREALGEIHFQKFEDSLAKLNYKEAIVLLEPLMKTLGES